MPSPVRCSDCDRVCKSAQKLRYVLLKYHVLRLETDTLAASTGVVTSRSTSAPRKNASENLCHLALVPRGTSRDTNEPIFQMEQERDAHTVIEESDGQTT